MIVRGEQLPAANEVRAAMHQFGGSVVVAVIADILKVHVHTDTPEAVFTYAGRWGTLTVPRPTTCGRNTGPLHLERRPVAVVTDTSADLPDSVLDRHHIALVPLQVLFGDTVFQDRVGMRPGVYRRLRGARTLPTTSQPTPGDFIRVFRSALEEADEVVAVLLGSALSGTCQAAHAAVKAAGLERVTRWTARRRRSAWVSWRFEPPSWRSRDGGPTESPPSSTECRPVGCVTDGGDVRQSDQIGTVSRGKAWLAGMLDVKPILGLDPAGRVVPVDRVGTGGRHRRMLALVDRRWPRPGVVRFGVVHVEAPEIAERVRTALVAAYRPKDCFVSLAFLGPILEPGRGRFAGKWRHADRTDRRSAGRVMRRGAEAESRKPRKCWSISRSRPRTISRRGTWWRWICAG